MERWVGRVALVTGASVGMGRAIAMSLARHGMRGFGCARNVDQIKVKYKIGSEIMRPFLFKSRLVKS